MGELYQLSFPNGMSYIGITVKTAKHRFRQHARAVGVGSYAVTRAIWAWGVENVECRTLVVADDYEYLKMIERRAIAAYRTKRPHGYNLTDGGDGMAGFTFSKESRERMARAARGKSPSEETRAKLSAALKGRATNAGTRRTDEQRDAMSKEGLLRAPASNNVSGVRGVSWHKAAGKWQARVKIKGRVHHLGLFVEKDKAIACRAAFIASYIEEQANVGD